MSDVCIYTANYGAHDAPRTQAAQDVDVDWLYYLDPRHVVEVPEPWTVHRVPTRLEHPNLAAKWWKLHPPVGYERGIWIDASMEVTSPSFAREAIAALERPTPGATYSATGGVDPLEPIVNRASFGVWKHPRRDDFLDEIIASCVTEAADKYADVRERMIAQGDAYFALGLPRHSGLYACGTIVWTPDAWRLAADWWDECIDWTFQDQVSLPFVCWAHHTKPAVFPVPQIDRVLSRGHPYLANRWLRIWPHG